jgi:hypothetical protein
LPKIIEEDKNNSIFASQVNLQSSTSIILPSKSNAGGIISRAAAAQHLL